MGASKTYQYTNTQNQFARTAKAIGHPARIAIMQYLSSHGIGTLRDMMLATSLSGPTVSEHLGKLVEAGLAENIWLREHYWQVNPAAEKQIADLMKCLGSSGNKRNGI